MVSFVSAKTEMQNFETDIDIIIKEKTNTSSANVTLMTEEWNKTYLCNNDESYDRTIEFERNVTITEEDCETMLGVCADIGQQYSTLLPYIASFNYSERFAICNGLKAEYKTKWESNSHFEGLYNNCTNLIETKDNEIDAKQDEFDVCTKQKNEMLTEEKCEEEHKSNPIYYLLLAGAGYGICWWFQVRKPEAKGGGEGTRPNAL